MERIHRTSLNQRLSEVIEVGRFDTSVNFGFRGEINYIDAWGPTFTCPTMEHIGVIGDGGKWVCGVNEFLQRPGCIIYSFGSFFDYSFEADMLERTPCEIHVFDPTVLPSQMREREALLNGDGPTRITWHSIGISDTDTDESTALTCYGGTQLLPQHQGRRLNLVDRRWRPDDEEVSEDMGSEPEVMTRDEAMAKIIDKLRDTRDRVLSSEERCGQDSRLPRGVAPLPEPMEDVGTVLADMNETPHGDAQTLCRMATLPSIMKTLGHDWLDNFKIDVEGSEFRSFTYLASLPGDAMRFTQLQLELHFGGGPSGGEMPNVDQLEVLHGLLENNYRMTLLEPNIYFAAQTCHELAMLKVDECGNVVTPMPDDD